MLLPHRAFRGGRTAGRPSARHGQPTSRHRASLSANDMGSAPLLDGSRTAGGAVSTWPPEQVEGGQPVDEHPLDSGVLREQRPKSFTTNDFRSILASMLPARRQLCTTSHRATPCCVTAAIRSA